MCAKRAADLRRKKVGIENILQSAQGKAAIDNLSRAFGLAPAQAAPAVASLGDALSWRIERNLISRGGVADVVGLLGKPQAALAVKEPQNLAGADVADAGNGVLDVLIGSKHVSRGIAARTAAATGIDESVARKMLPVVASLMVGGLQRQAAPQFAKIMRDVPGLVSRNGSPLPLPGEVPMDSGRSGGGRSAAPDRDAGTRSGRPISGGSPLPLPGDTIPGAGRDQQDEPGDSPYGNLPDIIRRGGVQLPNGGSLDDVIRSVLGGLLGFKNRGVIGTLIQAFLLRWIANLIRRFFTRGR
jgi:hypothetical protein